MTFGQLKTIYENYLIQSYKDKKIFKQTLKEFKKDILENKNLSKVFTLYSELSTPQGLSESDASQFLTDGIETIKKTLTKIKLPKKKIDENFNFYKEIDSLVYEKNSIELKERLESRKFLLRNLSNSKTKIRESLNIPLSTMLNIANTNVNKFMSSLDESSKKEVIYILKEDRKEIEKKFMELKKETIKKLTDLKEGQDSESENKINETINKISSENFDLVNFLKLKNLNETI